MMRHKVNAHPELFRKEDMEEESEEDVEKQSKDDQTEETDDGSETDTESDDEESEAENESDADNENEAENESEADADDDAQSYNLWKYLHDVALKDPDISAQWDDARERLANPELNDKELDEQAWSVVTPNILKHINTHYANFLKLWHFAKHNETQIKRLWRPNVN